MVVELYYLLRESENFIDTQSTRFNFSRAKYLVLDENSNRYRSTRLIVTMAEAGIPRLIEFLDKQLTVDCFMAKPSIVLSVRSLLQRTIFS